MNRFLFALIALLCFAVNTASAQYYSTVSYAEPMYVTPVTYSYAPAQPVTYSYYVPPAQPVTYTYAPTVTYARPVSQSYYPTTRVAYYQDPPSVYHPPQASTNSGKCYKWEWDPRCCRWVWREIQCPCTPCCDPCDPCRRNDCGVPYNNGTTAPTADPSASRPAKRKVESRLVKSPAPAPNAHASVPAKRKTESRLVSNTSVRK